MTNPPCFYRMVDGGLELFVRLTPKSSRDAIEGATETVDGRSRLKLRIRAAPENGKANAALEKLLAKQLGVSASAVSVTGGKTSRLKTVEIKGERDELIARLTMLTAQR